MKYHSLSLPLFFLLAISIASKDVSASESQTIFSDIRNTTITCLHWIFCPYCLLDSERQTHKFEAAIKANDPQVIDQIIQRRGISPNHILIDDSMPVLPLILAAKKAHIESVKELLLLGADVNSQIQGNGFNNYPSSLIAVCAAEKLDPELVRQTVETLLRHGADPSRKCIMLTETERTEFLQLQEELQKKPGQEEQILAKKPQSSTWLRQRTALDFARKHKYVAAAELIKKALAEPRTQGPKKDEKQDDLFE